MNPNRIKQLLSLLVSFELIITPVMAQMMPQQTAPMMGPAPMGTTNTAQIVGNVLDLGVSIYSQIQRPRTSPQLASDMASFQSQQTPSPDKVFNAQNLMKIPGLGAYLSSATRL